SEIEDFDRVPNFDDGHRKTFFSVSSFEQYRDHFRKASTLVAFILLKGYFQFSGRFYQVKDFRPDDIQYVSDLLELDDMANLEGYPRNTFSRQKRIIAKSLGIKLFPDWKSQFEKEVDGLVKTALKPKQIIKVLVRICQEKRIEVPRYHIFAQEISTSIRKLENELVRSVDESLNDEQKSKIDAILEMGKSQDRPISPSNPYLVTTIKTPEQEIAPRKIRESLNDFLLVSDLYVEFKNTLDKIDLSDKLLNYYAVWLIKSSHVKFLSLKEPSKKHLYFLAFIVYQYRIRQDLFVDTLLKLVQKFENEVEKSITEDFLKQRPVKIKQAQKIINMVRSLSDYVEHIRGVVFSKSQTDSEKVNQIQRVFSQIDNSKGDRQAQRKRIEEELEKLQSSLSSGLKEQMMYEKFLAGYRRIQNRVAGIARVLDFNFSTSNSDLCEAIQFFKSHEQAGNIKKLPTSFLDQKSKTTLKTYTGSEWKLWKVLLFIQIKEHIKSGSLNLCSSERYRAVEEYLISQERWDSNRIGLLERADLPFEIDADDFLNRMSKILHNQYVRTNKNVDKNEFISFTSSGATRISTPKEDKKEESGGLLRFLEDESGGVIPLPIVLSEVNSTSKFLECFSHFAQKGHKRRPSTKAFYAAIIAFGCNIGIGRMAKISNGISVDNLNHLVKWYFSKENLDAANGKINSVVDQMSLPKIYKKNIDENHTSSDGQKFSVVVPSIHANYSFKYFGSGKGISAYSFIDETNRLFYNTVISSSEREAAYVIDGLMHNEDVESSIHSTDTHGYSEIIFAITSGIGVFFAPRIKNFKSQMKYTFKDNPKRMYEKMDFKVAPTVSNYIDPKIITEQGMLFGIRT
ncbi:MAG: Tn3 family transposase, partial [Bacteroidota bacterium]